MTKAKPIGMSDLAAITKAYLEPEYPDLPAEPSYQTLLIPAPAQLLTTNIERNLHHHTRAEIVKLWRHAAATYARNLHLGTMGVVTVEAHVSRKVTKGRTPDADAFAPTIKACLDGIVDAGVLVDDGPKYVRAITYHACTPAERDEVRLVLHAV